jgi:large conductance mechanosensitive channel
MTGSREDSGANMSGFKAFILRGNLVELAVAFIMGASFATVVTTFTAVILGFVSKIFGGSPNFDNIELFKEDGVAGTGIPIGTFLTALIAFLILAAVVYFFVVVPYTKAKERFFPSAEPDGTPEDVVLLTEIRDALVGGRGPGV